MKRPDAEAYAILRQLGEREITINDIRKAYNVPKADNYAKRMIGHGLLRRIGFNRYLLVPPQRSDQGERATN